MSGLLVFLRKVLLAGYLTTRLLPPPCTKGDAAVVVLNESMSGYEY